jgi:hypothetical protein
MGEWHLLDIRLQMEALITEREGMIADNQFRIAMGEIAVYNNEDFSRLAGRMTSLLVELRSL